uniref:Uncharacterized protein n=1 Tax=Syphacia muris TaxID=451379 RepID=A0A0N5A9I3_9BILA
MTNSGEESNVIPPTSSSNSNLKSNKTKQLSAASSTVEVTKPSFDDNLSESSTETETLARRTLEKLHEK